MSTDARLQEHHVSKALLPGPRRTPKFPARPILHVPTRSRGLATILSHAPSGDRTRHPRGRLTGLDSLPCDQCEGTKADTTGRCQLPNEISGVGVSVRTILERTHRVLRDLNTELQQRCVCGE